MSAGLSELSQSIKGERLRRRRKQRGKVATSCRPGSGVAGDLFTRLQALATKPARDLRPKNNEGPTAARRHWLKLGGGPLANRQHLQPVRSEHGCSARKCARRGQGLLPPGLARVVLRTTGTGGTTRVTETRP